MADWDAALGSVEYSMGWYRIAGSHPFDQLQDVFDTAWTLAGTPKSAALFLREPEKSEPEYYLSPGAGPFFGGVIKMREGQLCSAPPRSGTILLVGHTEAFDMLDG